MTATIVSVAGDVVTEIQSLSLSESATVERSYADWDWVLESDFNSLRIDVVPASFTSELNTRGKLQYVCSVNVLLRKKMVAGDREATGDIDESSVDALVEDLQTIHEHFAPSQLTSGKDGLSLTNFQAARWLPESAIRELWSPVMLKDHSQFSGWLTVVFSVPVAP